MIAITGGAGFIGSAVAWHLNQAGRTDLLIVDELQTSDKWRNLANLRIADFVAKDSFLALLTADRLPPLEAIVHMGAITSTTEIDVDRLLRDNYEYTKVIATHCVARGVRLVYASSAATYGDGTLGYSDEDAATESLLPLNPYGYSKQLFDLWALREGLLQSIVGLKFFNVFGPNEYHKGDMTSVVYQAFNQIRERGSVRLFKSHDPRYADGGQQRDFVYVKDCVRVIQWFLDHRDANGLFNLGTGRARTFRDLALATFAAMEVPERIEYIPMPAPLQGKYQYFTQADDAKLRRAGCNVAFGTLEDSVADYIRGHLAQLQPHLRTR